MYVANDLSLIRKNREPIACIDLKYYRYTKNPNLEKPFGFSLIGATIEYPDFHFSASDSASESLWETYLRSRATAKVNTLGRNLGIPGLGDALWLLDNNAVDCCAAKNATDEGLIATPIDVVTGS